MRVDILRKIRFDTFAEQKLEVEIPVDKCIGILVNCNSALRRMNSCKISQINSIRYGRRSLLTNVHNRFMLVVKSRQQHKNARKIINPKAISNMVNVHEKIQTAKLKGYNDTRTDEQAIEQFKCDGKL